MNSFSFCENSFKSVKSRHSELSKMVRHFIFTEKMTPIVGTGSRNKNSDFTNFVKFFCEIKVPKWQSRKSQNLSVLLKFFTFKHLKMIENRLPIINSRLLSSMGVQLSPFKIKKCVQEIDMDMIIKMFDNLPPKIVKAKNHGLDSLL